MIYITGDTHADWGERFNTSRFPEQKAMTKDDYVIVCGDFGIWTHSKRQEYWLEWLEHKPFTTLFVSGNHENYDLLDILPVEEWNGGKINRVRPSIIHLMRGQTYQIAGKRFFTFGGAQSHDIQEGILRRSDPDFDEKRKTLDKMGRFYRIEHETGWARELPSEDEMREGWKNLQKVDNCVDYIITHCPWTSMLLRMRGSNGTYQPDILTDYLQEIREKVTYRQWYFGHMHENARFPWENASCLYEGIWRIE